MRAAVLTEAGLSVREWKEPEPGPGEALVALTKVGICGSDVHFAVDGTTKPRFLPIVLGHEPAGTVEALGPDTDGPPIGTRVAIVPLVTCMECDVCLAGRTVICKQNQCLGAEREGAWADLIAVPVRNLIPLPDGLADEVGAVATDSVATAYHAVATRGGVTEGSRVSIWGAGGLGSSAISCAVALGASKIIAVDPRAEARERALASGATEALDPEQGALRRIADEGGVDIALEFVGHTDTCEAAVRSLTDGGRAVVVGLGDGKADAGRLVSFVPRERELVGSYGAEPWEVGKVIEMIADGSLSLPNLIGDVIPLGEVNEGLRRVQAGDTGGARIVLDIQA
jgi:threonine dehydrogenase-like Zn-dependent dehydrogenase